MVAMFTESTALRRLLAMLGALLLAATLVAASPATAQRLSPSADELCTARDQARYGNQCGDQGPAAERVSHWADRETIYPLPRTSIDGRLSYLPFRYLRLSSDKPTRLYTSPRDARDGVNSHQAIEPGFDYVSWLECQMLDGKAIYMVEPGIYMRGGSDCSQIATPDFSGLELYRTPVRPFAWVLGGTFTQVEPASESYTANWAYRFQVVQILEEREVNGQVWYRIGPEDWIEQRLLSVVRPDRTRPEGVEGDRWISINLFEQTISIYENGELVFATMVSSGLRGWWTQPGSFRVYAKLERDTMSGAFEADRSDYYYLQDVPWVLYYDQARAIHGAYWHNGYGYPRSHGCVNLSPTDAQWIFEWAEEGTWVHVYDPSGETPTDSELYGAGGA
jgi:hypothetical protein